jgi:hypothetical protein
MNDFHDHIFLLAQVKGTHFEYRIHGGSFTGIGGLWEAPVAYSFVSTGPGQTSGECSVVITQWVILCLVNQS